MEDAQFWFPNAADAGSATDARALYLLHLSRVEVTVAHHWQEQTTCTDAELITDLLAPALFGHHRPRQVTEVEHHLAHDVLAALAHVSGPSRVLGRLPVRARAADRRRPAQGPLRPHGRPGAHRRGAAGRDRSGRRGAHGAGAVLTLLQSPPEEDGVKVDTWDYVTRLRKWFDADAAPTSRGSCMCSRFEAPGEVAEALHGALGANPRKGASHDWGTWRRSSRTSS